MKYYLLTGSIQNTTEKAFAVAVGHNGCITKDNIKVFVEWIPYSIIKEKDNQKYIPAWFVMTNKLQGQVDFKNYIEAEEETKPKQRKTKEQRNLEKYNLLLNNNFNNEVPTEYIEYWFAGMESIENIRFTTIDKLENRLSKENIIKINIVREGEKKRVK